MYAKHCPRSRHLVENINAVKFSTLTYTKGFFGALLPLYSSASGSTSGGTVSQQLSVMYSTTSLVSAYHLEWKKVDAFCLTSCIC